MLELNSRPSGMLSTRTILNKGKTSKENKCLPEGNLLKLLVHDCTDNICPSFLCRCLLTCRGLSRFGFDGGWCSGLGGRKEP